MPFGNGGHDNRCRECADSQDGRNSWLTAARLDCKQIVCASALTERHAVGREDPHDAEQGSEKRDDGECVEQPSKCAFPVHGEPNAKVNGRQSAKRVDVPLNELLGKGQFGRQEKPRKSAVC
jgi:hypothetical protein